MDTADFEVGLTPPATYEQWLRCFDLLRLSTSVDSSVAMTIANGSLAGKGYIIEKFHQKLADTITEMLNKRFAWFVKDLNMLLNFNELLDIAPLFVKLRNQLEICLVLTRLSFLEADIQASLALSVRTQAQKFWGETVGFLQRQSVEVDSSDLNDSLFLIRRINLFEDAA